MRHIIAVCALAAILSAGSAHADGKVSSVKKLVDAVKETVGDMTVKDAVQSTKPGLQQASRDRREQEDNQRRPCSTSSGPRTKSRGCPAQIVDPRLGLKSERLLGESNPLPTQ